MRSREEIDQDDDTPRPVARKARVAQEDNMPVRTRKGVFSDELQEDDTPARPSRKPANRTMTAHYRLKKSVVNSHRMEQFDPDGGKLADEDVFSRDIYVPKASVGESPPKEIRLEITVIR